LKDFIPALSAMDLDKEVSELKIPSPLKNSLILYKGEFTQNYRYMEEYLKEE
jgi:hypothetical protein